MAMESLESLQAYLQGLMNLGGTTAAGRPGVQALFTAMDNTVNDINGVYTTLTECKRQYSNDDTVTVASSSAASPCPILVSAASQIDVIEKQAVTAAAADPKTDLTPLQAKLESAKTDLGEAVKGFTSAGVCK